MLSVLPQKLFIFFFLILNGFNSEQGFKIQNCEIAECKILLKGKNCCTASGVLVFSEAKLHLLKVFSMSDSFRISRNYSSSVCACISDALNSREAGMTK